MCKWLIILCVVPALVILLAVIAGHMDRTDVLANLGIGLCYEQLYADERALQVEISILKNSRM